MIELGDSHGEEGYCECSDLFIKCRAVFSNEKSFSYAASFPGVDRNNWFPGEMWCGCAARWHAGSDCLDVYSCSSVSAFRFLRVSPIYSIRQSL